MPPKFKAGFGALVTSIPNERSDWLRDHLPETITNRLPDLSRDGVAVSDLRDKDCPLVYVNRAFQEITGYVSNELVGKNCRFLQGSDRLQPEIHAVSEAIARRTSISVTLKNYRKDGTLFWNDLRLVPVSADGQEATHYIGLIRNVTAGKNAAEQIEHSARSDLLTGALNRYAFIEEIGNLLIGRQEQILISKIDMAGFHDINEGYGYDVGDQVLKQIAQRLSKAGIAVVSRTGSDEFGVAHPLMPGQSAQTVNATIRSVLSQSFVVAGATINMRFALGYVVGSPMADAMTLVRQAGVALRRSKSSAFLEVREFKPEDERQARNRLRLTREMQQALANDEFGFYYQPQVALDTGTLVGAEALLRWHHGLFGTQQPGKFIEHAEDTGLILDIGSRGLRAIVDYAQLTNDGRATALKFSMNVSAVEFKLRDMPQFVHEVVSERGVNPAWITLELTESLMVESSGEMLSIMRDLRQLGVGLSIDDFGTGYANLRYLEELPITEIKIDRTFVAGLQESRSKQIIVESIIRISNELGFRVVAEGIETDEDCERLRDMNCPFGQGFFFGKAVDAATFTSLSSSVGEG
ncbi:putative bifunctional diguanylate cyclase/phosphodiesterase [Mesorhizobium sp. B4-1-4]|uniref:putative bifunctional diguanylate cyclase/phosphodiesterase n=1 Tax=Mesorhizobium sp. B4-1-4 TaxID=2589888 RepID=UPI001126FF3A|nr:GGDEF domain-containing phosphodiesterase [Mesorhizobium sp. B4-1-4]UCI33234.1 EAL domain-containing protein [Mesorhizobium sp. B4-1-4]